MQIDTKSSTPFPPINRYRGMDTEIHHKKNAKLLLNCAQGKGLVNRDKIVRSTCCD